MKLPKWIITKTKKNLVWCSKRLLFFLFEWSIKWWFVYIHLTIGFLYVYMMFDTIEILLNSFVVGLGLFVCDICFVLAVLARFLCFGCNYCLRFWFASKLIFSFATNVGVINVNRSFAYHRSAFELVSFVFEIFIISKFIFLTLKNKQIQLDF